MRRYGACFGNGMAQSPAAGGRFGLTLNVGWPIFAQPCVMTQEPTSDLWIPACDLCGSLRFETIAGGGGVVRRCNDCGLVSVEQPHGTRGCAQGAYLPDTIACAALSGLRGTFRRSVLIIGTPSPAITAAIRETGATATVLSDQPGINLAHDAVRFGSLESAAFAPDSFDMVLLTMGLECIASPALLFDRVSAWLVPGGMMVMAALNFDALPARIRRQRWLGQHTDGVHHLFTQSTLADYANRFGFAIRTVRTQSRIQDVAGVIVGGNPPAWPTEMAMAPLALAANLLKMGMVLVVAMERRGLAMRPALRLPEESAESAPGLAPALYSGVRYDHVADG